jgi:rhodanese-related sulfurtransferase
MNRMKWVWTAALLSALFAASSVQAAEPAPKLLEPTELRLMLQRGEDFVLIAAMSRLECMDHSIPGSLCVAEEEFAAKAPGLLPDRNRPLVFYGDLDDLSERSRGAAALAIQQGYKRVSVLKGGIPAWREAGFDTVSQERIPRFPSRAIKPERLARWLLEKQDPLILDIRREERFRERHLPGAINIPLFSLHERYSEIPLNRPVLVVDERGLRSFLASSYLIRKGIVDVTRLFGGMEQWQGYDLAKKGN